MLAQFEREKEKLFNCKDRKIEAESMVEDL